MARSRFDDPTGAQSNVQGSPGKNQELIQVTAGKSKNPHTVKYIDQFVDTDKAINELVLPASTMYLIDKVVRAKALQGPIGVDNSEVINIELEREFKARNRYLANLANIKDDDGEEDEEDMTPDERVNADNEKLLQRLYKAAQKDIDADRAQAN